MIIPLIISRKTPILKPNELIVFLYNGQSNGSGRSTTLNNLPLAWQGVQNNIKIWVKSNYPDINGNSKINPEGFELMNPLYNTATYDYDYPHWSTEQSLLHDVLTKYPNETLYIFKNTYGGQQIIQWAENATNPAMWTNFVNGINGIESYLTSIGKTPKYINIWMQGEEDCYDIRSQAWGAKFENVISRIRNINSNLMESPFLVIKMYLQAPWSDTYQTIINNSIDNIQSIIPKIYTFDPNIYNDWQPDSSSGHYTDIDYIRIGHYYFNILNTNKLF